MPPRDSLLIVLLAGVLTPVPSQDVFTQHDDDIRVHYSSELDQTQVWLGLDLRSSAHRPAPPGTHLRFELRYDGKRPVRPPEAVGLVAHAGFLWSPRPELSVRLEQRRHIDLAARRVQGGMDQDGTLMFLPVTVPIEILQQIARASRVTGSALGFEFELTATQREALDEFVRRVLSADPAVPGAPPVDVPGRWTEPTTGMRFIRIPAGHFVMGSPLHEHGREAQERPHEAVISRPLWMGALEVTQREWQAVMSGNPSRFAGDGRPVERVNWFEAQAFARRLTARSPGSRFRLPTETEWEYACRAGTTTAYHTGSSLTPGQSSVAPGPGTDVGGAGTASAGIFPPNPWGLYDMHGNVWEWTADDHCPYPEGPAIDPERSCDSPFKVIRGGSWYFTAGSARCALRFTHRPRDRGFSLGFRVVREQLY